MIAGVTRAIGRQAVKHLGKAKAAVAKGAAQNVQKGVEPLGQSLRQAAGGATYSTLFTGMQTGNPVAAAATGAIDLGVSALLGPKLQRAMLASNNPMAQLMAPAAAGALQAGVSFAAPDVAEAIVGSAEGRDEQTTSTPQQTVQAIADPRNEVATQRTLMLQRMGMLGSLSPVVPRRDISQYVMGIDDF
jgi:hypothetical protein